LPSKAFRNNVRILNWVSNYAIQKDVLLAESGILNIDSASNKIINTR